MDPSSDRSRVACRWSRLGSPGVWQARGELHDRFASVDVDRDRECRPRHRVAADVAAARGEARSTRLAERSVLGSNRVDPPSLGRRCRARGPSVVLAASTASRNSRKGLPADCRSVDVHGRPCVGEHRAALETSPSHLQPDLCLGRVGAHHRDRGEQSAFAPRRPRARLRRHDPDPTDRLADRVTALPVHRRRTRILISEGC
jgi:hypothetical protein